MTLADHNPIPDDDAPEHPLSALLSAAQADDERTISHARKLEYVFDFTRGLLDESNIAAVETLRNIGWTEDFVSSLNADDPADCQAKLTDIAHMHKIIILQGASAFHAEQKLIVALWRSGSKFRAVIHGKKRPCMACAASLAFATEKLKLRIQFNEKPGGYWSTSNAGLQTIINFGINAGKITKEEAEKWVKRFYKKQTSHQTRSLVPGIRRTTLKSTVHKHSNKDAVMHDTGNVSDSDSDEEF